MSNSKTPNIIVKKPSRLALVTKIAIKKFIKSGGKNSSELDLGLSGTSSEWKPGMKKISLEQLSSRKLFLTSFAHSPTKPIILNTIFDKEEYENFGIEKIYDSKPKFEDEINIEPFKDLRKKYNLGKASKDEKRTFEICRDYQLVFGIRKDIYEKNELGEDLYYDGVKKLKASGGDLVVATTRPTMAISNLDFDEIVLISPKVISSYWGVDNLSFFNSKDLDGDVKKKVMFLLNYMEKNDISDLHMAQADDESYFLAARRHTKMIDVKDDSGQEVRYSVVKAKNIVNMLLQMGSADTESIDLAKNAVITADLDSGRRNFRLNVLSTINNNERGFSFSLRMLPKDEEVKSLEKLNYMKIAIQMLIYAISFSKGLITISGRTNSGKSTLLAALQKMLRDDFEETKIIIRVGNPIEINLDKTIMVDPTHYGLNENDEIEDLPKAINYILKNTKRHDPCVVSLEEVRSNSERKNAIDCAKAGWLTMLSTHAGTLEECISDFLNVEGVTKRDLNSVYLANVSKELILRPCMACKDLPHDKKHECENCGGSGTSGVLPVFDFVLYVNVGLDDDIMETDKLVEENKAIRITKEDCLEYYEAFGLIDKDQEVVFITDIGGNDVDINEFMANFNKEKESIKKAKRSSAFASDEFIKTRKENDVSDKEVVDSEVAEDEKHEANGVA